MVFGLAPTAKAARVLERDTRMRADTVAKLLYEWRRTDRPPEPGYRLPAGATVIVDEASMISTPDLHELVRLAETQRWRLVLVGDHRQLQAVGRGGLFAELCANGRVDELEHLHRFTHRWEAAASLMLRSGDPRALDAYEAHDRIVPGPLDEHVERMAQTWIEHDRRGDTVALVASTNDHVDAINRHVQAARLARCDIDPHWQTLIAGGEVAHDGDVVVTRRNDRRLRTDLRPAGAQPGDLDRRPGHRDGSLTVTQRQGHGTAVLPADYVNEHVRLGYAATEHGYQSDTVTTGIALASASTTRAASTSPPPAAATATSCASSPTATTSPRPTMSSKAVLALDRGRHPRRHPTPHPRPHRAAPPRRGVSAAAASTRPSGPPTQPRCPVPAWFDQLLDDTRQQAATVERANDERRSAGRRLIEASNDAQNVLRRVSAETAAARTEYAAASRRLASAEADRRIATRLVNESGWRGRRHARQHLADADVAVIIARSTLEQAETATAPHRQRYRSAFDAAKHADGEVHRHQLSRMLRPDKSPEPLYQRIATLQSWRRWADSQPVSATEVADAMTQLRDDAAHDPTGHLRQLCDLVHLISPAILSARPGLQPLRRSGPSRSL